MRKGVSQTSLCVAIFVCALALWQIRAFTLISHQPEPRVPVMAWAAGRETEDERGVGDASSPGEPRSSPSLKDTATPTPERTAERPMLQPSYGEGAPHNTFTATGPEFPQSDQASIRLNGRFAGAAPGDNWFQFSLDTRFADAGLYGIIAQAGSVIAGEFIIVDVDEP